MLSIKGTNGRIFLSLLLAVLFSQCFDIWRPAVVEAYRIGDGVDTELSVDSSSPSDVLRRQMPLFGISSKTKVQIPFSPGVSKFALSFEDGLWGLPTAYLTNSRGEGLQKLLVTFVYSKSGNGAIHSVGSEKVYDRRAVPGNQIQVDYIWIEEEQVNVNAGQAIMFLISFFAGVVMLIASCGLFEEQVPATATRTSTIGLGGETTSSSVPKWD